MDKEQAKTLLDIIAKNPGELSFINLLTEKAGYLSPLASVSASPAPVALVKEKAATTAKKKEEPGSAPSKLEATVCEVFGVTSKQLHSGNPSYRESRWALCGLGKELAGLGPHKLTKAFGLPISTTNRALSLHAKSLKDDASYAAKIAEVKRQLTPKEEAAE